MAQSNLAVISENGVFNVKSAVKNATLLKAKPPINDAVMYNDHGQLLTTTQYQGNSLGEAIDAQAKAYKSIKKQAKAALEKLKGIGDVLNYVRSLFKSDVLFGQFLMKTELSIMYLRQAIRKASATVQRSEAPDVVAVATVEPQVKPTATVQSEALNVVEKPVAATVEHSTLKPTVQESLDSEASPVVDTLEIIVDDAEAFADSVANLAKAEGLDLNAVIEALLKRV
jgi:hypothetical protein